jgi:hypothetical protein
MTSMMNHDEEHFFTQFLTKESVVLEYGSGGSTVAFGGDAKEWHSIEHDKEWFDRVQEALLPTKSAPERYKNVHCYLAENTPLSKEARERAVDSFGEDVVIDGIEDEFKDYINMVHKIGVKKYDIVLIDGRARALCLEQILPYLKETSFVYVHDWQRAEYHACDNLKYYTDEKVISSGKIRVVKGMTIDGTKEMVRLRKFFPTHPTFKTTETVNYV